MNRLASAAFALSLTCGPGVAACGSSSSGSTSAGITDAGLPDAFGTESTLYVTVYGLNEISVVDEATRTVSAHIPVGKGPAIILSTPPGAAGGLKLYTANWLDSTISAVDAATRAVKSIKLDARPWVVAMSPDGHSVYAGVGQSTGGAGLNKIVVIDTATDAVTRTIDTGGMLPESIIVSPQSDTLYVTLVDTSTLTGLLQPGSLEAISASTGTVTQAPITVGASPAWITMTPDGAKVYTLNFVPSTISVVDVASWTVTATPSAGSTSEPIIGGVTPDGKQLVVTNYGKASVVEMDTATNQLAPALPIDGRPVGVAFRADGKRAYVTSFGHASLALTPSVTAFASGDISGAIGPGPGEIVTFDPATGKAIGASIPVGKGPTSIVVAP